jgi:hypothetical protein
MSKGPEQLKMLEEKAQELRELQERQAKLMHEIKRVKK